MAISRARLLKELLPGLNELFGTEYEKNVWMVHAEYNHHDMTYRVIKITPWWARDSEASDFKVFKITDAVDEMDAYKKFMERAMTVPGEA